MTHLAKEGWVPIDKSWFSEGTIGMDIYSGSTVRNILEGRVRPKSILNRPIEYLYGMRETPISDWLRNERVSTIADLLNLPSQDLATSSAQKLDIYARLYLDFRTFLSVPPHARVVHAITAPHKHDRYPLQYVAVPKDLESLVINTVEQELKELSSLTNLQWLSPRINVLKSRFGLDNGIPTRFELTGNETAGAETSKRHVSDILRIFAGHDGFHRRQILSETGKGNVYPPLLELCHLLHLGSDDDIKLFSNPILTEYASNWRLVQTLKKIADTTGWDQTALGALDSEHL